MSTDSAPSVNRGDVTLQPSYFTSSLFVNPLRQDILRLIQSYALAYLKNTAVGDVEEPLRRQDGTDSSTRIAEQPVEGSSGDVQRTSNITGCGDITTLRGAENLASSIHTPAGNSSSPNARDLSEKVATTTDVDRTYPTSSTPPTTPHVHPQPFALFKDLWRSQGWCWLHFKVFDDRGRESFVHVVMRMFSEYFTPDQSPLAKVIALFGLYTFFTTQPSLAAPPASMSAKPPQLPGPTLYAVKHVPLPYDVYTHLISLPSQLLTPQLAPLAPYATHLLSTLLDRQAFHILPHSSLRVQQELPREYFIEDIEEQAQDSTSAAGDSQQAKVPKKKGRPTKRERAKKARDALGQLEKWLDKNTYTYPEVNSENGEADAGSSSQIPAAGTSRGRRTTHTLITHPPKASLAIYAVQKNEYLDAVDPAGSIRLQNTRLMRHTAGADSADPNTTVPAGITIPADIVSPESVKEREALRRANEAMLTRLKKIDEMAAEQGLEVGGEGGEMTGLGRVERAVKEMREGVGAGRRAGVLGLLEGAGMEDAGTTANTEATDLG